MKPKPSNPLPAPVTTSYIRLVQKFRKLAGVAFERFSGLPNICLLLRDYGASQGYFILIG
jgi:hypothetical protein